MRIYWFWPFVHTEDLVVPDAVPREGDSLVLHTMRGRVADDELRRGRVEVLPTLATVGDERESSLRWFAARSTSYAARSWQRHRALRNEAFDICHIVFLNYFTDWLDLRLLARRQPLVFEVHDVSPHESRLPQRLEHALLGMEYSAPGRIIVRHPLVKAALVEQFDVDAGRVDVVPWHVPVVAARESDSPSDRHQPTVLFFGTLRRNKGVEVLLRAIDQLRDRTDLRFVFAGRGAADIEQAIREARARDARITFDHGYVSAERKHDWYKEADVVALPYTEFQSTSAVLCDAYSFRVPVVASDVGALGATVRDDGTGWVVPAGDADALAGALLQAVDDAPALRAAGRRAAAVAAERTPAAVGACLRQLYDRVLSS